MGIQLDGRNIEMIAIGASAGGVEAMSALLAALPPKLDVALALVLHLPPDRPSLLADLFGRHCALRVKEAEDKEPIRGGVVYLAPPDYHLLIEPDRRFSLSCDEPLNYSRPSIDLLFESVAFAYGTAALGIVLSGANADGSAGLAAVRAAGGMAWVQNPAEAASAEMPRAAIERAGADEVLALNEMATRLGAKE